MAPAWIARLERRIGWLAVPNLALFFAVMTGVVALLSLARPEFREALILDPGAVRSGEAWRALTFLLVPPPSPPLWLALWLVVFYAFASRLERAWGEFRFTFYCLLGAASLVSASLASGREVSNSFFQTSLFLAFARLNPDFEVLIFFILPVKMRWLWLASVVMLALQLVASDWSGRLVIFASVVNYLVFFGADHWSDARYALRRRIR